MRSTAVRKSNAKVAVAIADSIRDASDYHHYLSRVQERFTRVAADGPLFTTDAPALFDVYMAGLSPTVRQHHNCHACRRFIDTYGGLVAIVDGVSQSVLWDATEAPTEVATGIAALEAWVAKAKVTGVFYDSAKVWGTPVTTTKGVWNHLAVIPSSSLVYASLVKTPHQASAEKAEDLKNVLRALAEFSVTAIDQAIGILKTDALYRSEKCLGAATWLRSLHDIRETKNRKTRDNLMWLAIAKAPAGFSHPRSSMIGTLLEDIIAGLPFDVVSKRFADKMHPLQYQRPQAAPSAGNIAQAEKVIEQMGLRASLERRFARLADIQAIWLPREVKAAQPNDGVFAHLEPKSVADAQPMRVPPVTLTWEKFCRTVLVEAESIEYLVPATENFCGLVTATNPDAPPILQWDLPDARNPVSWYVYNGGSPATRWGLRWNQFCKVTAVTYQPSAWNGGFDHHGNSVIFILDGAKDSADPTLCLFPEITKSELHGIRATIEAHSRTRKLSGADEASACGIRLQKGVPWNAVFRVVSKGLAAEYRLDRWD